MPSLTLDLFAEPAPAPVIGVDFVHPADFQESCCERCGGPMRFTEFGESECFEDCDEPAPVPSIAQAKKLGLDPHMYAFIAQAKHHGLTDPALVPACVTETGQRIYEEVEVARFANEVLRGVRSIKPTMTPERWAQATQKVREMGGKS